MNRGYRYREQVGADAAGMRVSAYLARQHHHSPLEVWEARVDGGEVEVQGHRAEAARPLEPGDWVTWDRPPWDEPAAPLHFGVIAEDSDLLAVDTPVGLPTMPAGGFLENTLLSLVRQRDPTWSPLHRLGRGTSGVVLFARGDEALAKLSRAWRIGGAEKHYLAVVTGAPTWATRVIDQPIGPVPHLLLGTIHAASAQGRRAHSEVEVIERGSTASVCRVRISTGKPHQIRIHAAWAGQPLVGDPLYGTGGVPRPDVIALPGDLGYLLHAHRLAVAHPTRGERVEFIASPPAGYAAR